MTAIHDRRVKFLSSVICTLLSRVVPSFGFHWPWHVHALAVSAMWDVFKSASPLSCYDP